MSEGTNGALGREGRRPEPQGREETSRWVPFERALSTAGKIKEGAVLVSSAFGFVVFIGHLLWTAIQPGAHVLVANLTSTATENLSRLAAVEGGFILVLWVLLSHEADDKKLDQLLHEARLAGGTLPEKSALAEAKQDADRFRFCFEWLLGSWMVLYAVLWIAHKWFEGFDHDSRPHQAIHLSLMAVNTASAVCLALGYQALGGHLRFGLEGQPRAMGPAQKWPIAVGVAFLAATVALYSGNYLDRDQSSKLLGFASGLGNAVAMGLLAGRISSPALGGTRVMGMGLHLYAAIQPVFGLVLDEPLVEFLAISIAIPLKAIMFWILSRAIGDGSLVALLLTTRARQREDGRIRKAAMRLVHGPKAPETDVVAAAVGDDARR